MGMLLPIRKVLDRAWVLFICFWYSLIQQNSVTIFKENTAAFLFILWSMHNVKVCIYCGSWFIPCSSFSCEESASEQYQN